MIITFLVYSYVIDINNQSMFIWYFIFFTIGSFYIQGIGQTIGIIFSNNQRMSVFVSISILILSVVFSNCLVKMKELQYTIQLMSMLNPIKLVFECLMILMYGFDRCTDREFSFPLYLFDIEDNDYVINLRILIVLFVISRLLPLIALDVKVNSFNNSNKYNSERSEKLNNFIKQKFLF